MEYHICDECGKELEQGTPVEIHFGYGSREDGTKVEFCSEKCAVDYLLNIVLDYKRGKDENSKN